MASMDVVGNSILKPDAYDKVTGGKGFPVNVSLPGMLHAKLLRSPYPHARILGMDASAAEKLPGVKAVLTPGDVPQRYFHPVFFTPPETENMVKDMLILSDRVRYAGQPVAAVAATTEEIAERALELIQVDYEELPCVFTPEAAVKEGAPTLHEQAPNNIAKQRVFEEGDLEAGFAEADYIFEDTYETQRVHTCYMEPRLCVVDCDQLGHITIHSSNQQIFGLREKLAYALEIPESQVTVIKPPYIGGGFGGKLDLGYIEPIAVLLSQKTGKPVRIEQTRYENFITTARHPSKVYLKTGVNKDGLFTARYVKSVMDVGAHATHGPMVMLGLGATAIYSYRCDNKKWEGDLVYTNNMLSGGYRGYGAPQSIFPLESQIDEICEELGWDPIEFRLKNAHQEGEQNPFLKQYNLDTYRYEDCLRQGAERIGWSERKAAGSGAGSRKRGMGLATQAYWVSGGMGIPDFYEHSGAIVKLNSDGTADLASATVDLGCGQSTILCQIVAEELGLPADRVRMVAHADTDTVPFDAPTHASRGTYCSGTAVRAGAAAAKKRLLQVASNIMEASPEDLEVRAGKVMVKGSPDTAVDVADVVKSAESPLLVEKGGEIVQPTSQEDKGTIIGVASLPPLANPVACDGGVCRGRGRYRDRAGRCASRGICSRHRQGDQSAGRRRTGGGRFSAGYGLRTHGEPGIRPGGRCLPRRRFSRLQDADRSGNAAADRLYLHRIGRAHGAIWRQRPGRAPSHRGCTGHRQCHLQRGRRANPWFTYYTGENPESAGQAVIDRHNQNDRIVSIQCGSGG